jgi:hypothetical protein
VLPLLAEVQVLESLQVESFHKSLSARPLYIPTSNHLLERDDDYDKAKKKGDKLICDLGNPELDLESRYTTPEQLKDSGWVQEEQEDYSQVTAMFEKLQPVFRYLKIVYKQEDSKFIRWAHDNGEKNAQGQYIDVSVCKLY